MQRILKVEGMMCQHCAARVKTALESVRGVRATVDLDAGVATVTAPDTVDVAALTAAVSEAGYSIAE